MTDKDLIARAKEVLQKTAAVPMGPAPAAPPMDPAMMGGAMPPGMPPPGMPPMDPAMMGGMPPGMPMDPAMMGGAMPPMDPAMMGGMPPVDPMTGMPMDPAMMGGAPPAPAEAAPAEPVMEGTPLTEERLVEILPQIMDEVMAAKAGEPSEADLEQRMGDLENQMMEIGSAIGLTPNVDPSEVGVVEGTDLPDEAAGAPGTEDVPAETDVIEEGITDEAIEAAAAPPGAQPMPGAAPPMAPPPGAMPAGMPVMASEIRRPARRSVGRIQDLVGKLRG